MVNPAKSHSFASDLVLVGGGHSHVEVLRRFAMKPEPGVRLTLVAREIEAPYSGMLPGLIAGHYRHDQAHIDLWNLAIAAGARLIHGEVVGIDLDRRHLAIRGRPPLGFDLLSLDIGSRPTQAGVPGVAEHTIAIKPVDRFLARWAEIETRLTSSARTIRLAVVGGGAGGIELMLALRHRLIGILGSPARLACTIATDGDEILTGHSEGVRRRFSRVLAERGITLKTGARVARVEPGLLMTAGAEEIAFDAACWATSASAIHWLADSGLMTDDDGFVRVDDSLRSISHPFVFATGDAAAIEGHSLAKAGVFAVREGPPLAENLRRAARGESPVSYHPQRDFLSLISTGDRYAIASRNGISWEGRWVWRLKDWIDRRWMGMYQSPAAMRRKPAMATPRPQSDGSETPAMRCGGCGAKLDGGMLQRVLGRLSPPAHPDVVIGLADADDAAALRVPAGKLLVQSVDFFRAIVDDPYLLGRITANHCLGDLYAMGAEPHTALAMATLPAGPEAFQERDLEQLLTGALAVLTEAGAALIGGHSGEGAELAFGLTVNGLAYSSSLTPKRGLKPGDALMLTKPLGTGALFAASMRGRAKAGWIDRAIDHMQQSNRVAASLLRRHGAQAVTDVTGFGLAGHLLEMLRASGVDAELEPRHLPALPGALEMLAQGIASTLAPGNLKLGVAVDDRTQSRIPAEVALLYDPQTAGGLIAGLPAAAAERCMDELRRNGYGEARVVGRVVPRRGESAAITLSA